MRLCSSPGLFVVLLTAVACGDASAGASVESASAPAVSTGAETPPPLAEAPAELDDSVHWVRNSAEYQASVAQAYALATLRLDALAEAGDLQGNWAVALDADETVISNSLYQKERREVGLTYTEESWAEWAARREATPLPGVILFLERVKALGGHVAIVTNRRQPLCFDTEANFREESIPFDVILCRTDTSEKEPRWALIEEGRAPGVPASTIVMWVGDNIEDFPGLDQESRHDPVVSDFGARFIVVPNPMYGSWMPNDRL